MPRLHIFPVPTFNVAVRAGSVPAGSLGSAMLPPTDRIPAEVNCPKDAAPGTACKTTCPPGWVLQTATPWIPGGTCVQSPSPIIGGEGGGDPTWEFCYRKGGMPIRVEEPRGTSSVCMFPDGSQCDTWQLYRGECKPANPSFPWVAATIGVAGLLVAAAAVYAMTRKRSAVPNANRWLRTGPEAALVLMPPAIPSYLAYRYAVSRMDPEDAAVAESWRDWMPGSEWDEDDLG